MARGMERRAFLGAAGAAVAASVAGKASAAEKSSGKGGLKIIGIACSPRKGRSTTAAVRAALDAAKEAAPDAEVELIELDQ